MNGSRLVCYFGWGLNSELCIKKKKLVSNRWLNKLIDTAALTVAHTGSNSARETKILCEILIKLLKMPYVRRPFCFRPMYIARAAEAAAAAAHHFFSIASSSSVERAEKTPKRIIRICLHSDAVRENQKTHTYISKYMGAHKRPNEWTHLNVNLIAIELMWFYHTRPSKCN